MLLTVFRKSPLTMTIAGILGLSALPAQALIMDTSAAYSQTRLNPARLVDSPLSDATSSSVSGAPGYSHSVVDGSFGYGRWEFSHAEAYVDAAGNIDVGVDGAGEFDNFAVALLSETFVNTSSSAQTYTFDFKITPGSIGTMIYDMVDGLDAGGYIESMFAVIIKVNGAAVWSSSVGLKMTGLGALEVNQSGATLGALTAADGSATYAWDAYSGSAALGTFAAGAAFDLSYEMAVFSRSVGSGGSDCSVYGDPVFFEDGSSSWDREDGKCPKAGTLARARDPFGLSSVLLDDSTVRGTAVTSPVTSVPVPASLGLAGVGIAGLAFARRRRAK